MSKRLVIVESPTKAKTIGKFLGAGYEVRASFGHVRDLPTNAAEIPAEMKKEAWSRLGIDVDHDFLPLYIVPEDKKKHIAELKRLVKDADEIYLATDEDREGESISWHLLEVLKPKVPTKRLVFHEITKEAIAHSLKNTREIDENLVKAQETRRIVDRLFGYSVSPLLWKKMAPGLSAGRVQSVAMRLLVQRERERISFRSADYWDLKAVFAKHKSSETFEAELTHVGDKRVALGKDFDADTGKLSEKADVILLTEAQAKSLREKIEKQQAKVLAIEEKPYSSKPYPPFTTSTLQQEGSRKLSFAAKRTMQVAQTLYENGFITYMRTDSTTLSQEAIDGARNLIKRDFGGEYLPSEPRLYKTKVRNAQEAHEAIRPAGRDFATFDEVKAKVGVEAAKLYELIWKRTVASQMLDSRGTRVGVTIGLGDATFRAAGKTIEFAGYLRAYVEGTDDPEAELADQEKVLPKMVQGEALDAKSLEASGHTTQPPARYTEGSLIKELERLGIGRPSTWATIVGVVLSRAYAYKKGTALVPTFLAHAVTGLMEGYFTKLVDYDFTAGLEDDLDAISRGEADSLAYLKKFYFGNGHPGLKELVEAGQEKIDPRLVNGLPIGTTTDGRAIEVRIGRFGPFISDGTTRASVPDGVAPDEMNVERATQLLVDAARGPQALGNDPVTGLPVYSKNGRFGPYVQLGDQKEGGDKPKMSSLLAGMDPATVTLETALQLLSLPRSLGKYPENGEEIIAANGRYGPYIKAGTDTRSITGEGVTPLSITLEQAIELLKQPKRRGRNAAPAALRALGKHPVSEKEVTIKSGRYGPYVTDGEVNASLQKGQDPQTLTMEDAVNLLSARAARIASGEGGKPKRGGGRGAKKKAAAKAPKAKAAKVASAESTEGVAESPSVEPAKPKAKRAPRKKKESK